MKDHEVSSTVTAAEKAAKELLATDPAGALAAVETCLAAIAEAGMSPPEKPVSASLQVRRAEALAALGRVDEASEVASAALAHPGLQTGSFLDKKPRDEALAVVVRIWCALGRFDDAIVAIKRYGLFGVAKPSRLDQTKHLVALAGLYARRGSVEAARARMEALATLDPKEAALDVITAWIRYASGDAEGARAELTRMVERRRRPEFAQAALDAIGQPPAPAPDPDLCLAMANGHLTAGRSLEAEHFFELVALGRPASAVGFLGLGAARALLGDAAGALAAFDEAGLRDGRSGPARMGRSHALGALGRLEESARAAQEALALDPSLALEVAALAVTRGDFGGAERVITPLLGTSPAADALGGRIAMAEGRVADAAARFGAASATDPTARVAWSEALLAAGDALGALDAATGAPNGQIAQARALAKLGRLDEAAAAARSHGGPAGVTLAAEVVHAAGGEWRSILVDAMTHDPVEPTFARAMARLDPGSRASWDHTAEGLERLRTDPPGALALFEVAERAEPGCPRHTIDAGRALVARGNKVDGVDRAAKAVTGSTDRFLLHRFSALCVAAKLPRSALVVWLAASKVDPSLQVDMDAFEAAHGVKRTVIKGDPGPVRATSSASELVRRYHELERTGRLHLYLREIEAMGLDKVPDQARFQVDLATASLRLWRHDAVERHVEAALGRITGRAQGERIRALTVRARLRARQGRYDEALVDTATALGLEPDSQTRTELVGRRAVWLARLGAGSLALQHADWLRRAEARHSQRWVGETLLALDDRTGARRAFALGEDVECTLGLAGVEAVLGEHDAARATLAGVSAPEDDAGFALRKARVHANALDPDGERAELERALALQPGLVAARLRLGEVAWDAGRRDEALDTWAALDHPAAAARVAHARANVGAGRSALAAFPTITQKRAHCGPAALDLVLRWFGRHGSQEGIAAVVRTGDGTPAWRIGEFLRDQGFVTARTALPLPRLRALIDAGVPALVEEEYSSSFHVAVVVGYDDELGVVRVQDPMTHEVRLTPYSELPRLRGLFGEGGIAAAPADDPRADVVRALGDDAAIVAAEQALRALREGSPPDGDAVIAAAPDLPLAHLAAVESAFAAGVDPLPRIEAAIARFPDAEWPRQALGRHHLGQGRLDVALTAFREAHERDPGDGNTLGLLGDLHEALGQSDEAVGAWRAALRVHPGQPDAHEGLGGRHLDAGELGLAEHYAVIAQSIGPQRFRPRELLGGVAEAQNKLDAALSHYDQAVERAPRRSFAKVARGRVLTRLGRRDDGLRSLDDALGSAPDHPQTRLDVARVFLELGDTSRALEVLDPLVDKVADHVTYQAAHAACLMRLGRMELGEPRIRAVLARAPGYAWAENELFRALMAAGRAADALAFVVESREREPARATHLLNHVEALFGVGAVDEALARGEALANLAGPNAGGLLDRLARMAAAAGRAGGGDELYLRRVDRSLDLARPAVDLMQRRSRFLDESGSAVEALFWAQLAAAFGQIGEPSAVEAFEALVRAHPDDRTAVSGLVSALEAAARGDEAFARSRAACDATGWRDPHLVRRHGELGWRLRIFLGSPVPAFDEALEKNPSDVGLIAALVQEQQDKGHGDSHYAVAWKKRLDALRADPGAA